MLINKLRPLAIWLVCTWLLPETVAQSRVTMSALEEADLSVDSLKLALTLTSEQTYVVALVNERYAVRFDSIRRSTEDRFVKFAKTVRLKRERDNELKFVLSEGQFRIYHSAQEPPSRTDPGIE
jgi:hypothetical protein